jgi:hypothetical protein
MRKTTVGITLSSIIACGAIAFGASTTATAGGPTCPTFTVLHNDKIGAITFPAGPYNVTDLKGVTCQQSSALFAQFLQDWDGVLPGGWALKQVGAARVFYSKGGHSFTATPAKTPTPGPSPAPSPSSLTCPGSFQVVHNDHIGAMSLPAGNYRINRLTSSQKLTCAQSASWFAYFLNHDYAGTLPAPWTMNTGAKTFYDGSRTNGFNVLKLTGLGEVMGSNPRYGDSICSTNFGVGATTTISGFTVPAGNYVVIATGSATCSRAMQLATETINTAELPSGWTIDKSVGWFHNRGGRYGFQLDPGASGSSNSFTG